MMTFEFPAGIDRTHFLKEYWQKKPLLMRAALPSSVFTLSPEELAGLACEPEIESRLLIEEAPSNWEVRHGPFEEDAFSQLPDDHWTLLVQDVDKYLPDVHRLISHFDFVPRWRIDDIMISYATDAGGVGPHSDAYDVFLMQSQGKRRWRLSYSDYSDSDLLPDQEQKILSRFETHEDWILEPGDVLYLPPGVAHWGTAVGNCMTYSLGFRAPNQQEIASDWFQYLIEQSAAQHLQDPDDLNPDRLAELTEGTISTAAGMLDALPNGQSADFRRWLGCYLTEPKPHLRIDPPEPAIEPETLQHYLHQGGQLTCHPWARLSWAHLDRATIGLFFNGDFMTMPPDSGHLVDALCRQHHLESALLDEMSGNPVLLEALTRLVGCGVLEGDEAS